MTTTTQTANDLRYERIRARDPVAAGFFVAVRTTKIYCRPACPARTPLRRNVAFFENRADAERAGYRPCKRCRPETDVDPQPLAEAIDRACRAIDAAEIAPTLAELSAQAGASPFHFQRSFTKRVGISPKQYALAVRERRLTTSLLNAPNVTDAALDAGFASPGALYDGSGVANGMTPRTFRAGGRGERIAYATLDTALGCMLVARTPRGICAIDLGDDRASLVERFHERFHAADLTLDERALATDVHKAIAIVEGVTTANDVPFDIRGTAFQRRVWRALQEIPYGETRTYGRLAEEIGSPSATRAVASACARNILAIAVPCHRVIRADGEPGDYRWGAERKRAILAREREGVS